MVETLKFYEKSHTYKFGKQELTSVTTFIGRFFKPFNSKEIARKLAKFKHNKINKRGVRYWLKEWKNAAQHGTDVHNILEKHINGQDIMEEYDEARTIEKATRGIEWYRKAHRSWDEPFVYPEFKVWDAELGLAGTIDLLVEENGEGSERVISIYDWKTNKNIKSKSYDGDMAKCPISHLEDCSFNKYALQLSIYAHILERQGYKIKDLMIVYLKEDKVVEIEVPYMKQEVEDMLND